jgi:uncharacterized protein YjiS (DUF1127 family)
MSAIIHAERFREQPRASRLLGTLRTGWDGFLRRREERRALLRLWQLGPHLVRDAGFDPEVVGAAVGGGWEDLRPSGLLLASDGPDRR